MVPNHIITAAKAGDTPTVETWLDAGGDVNAYEDGGVRGSRTLLLYAVANSHVELCRTLLARGADPSLRSSDTYHIPLWLAAYEAHGGLLVGDYTGEHARLAIDSPSISICRMLVQAGADLNARKFLAFGREWPYGTVPIKVQASLLARVLFFFGADPQREDSLMRLNLASMLLRAGAHVESIAYNHEQSDTAYSASWCVAQALAKKSYLLQDRHFIEARTLVTGITEAGSYKKWLRRPHCSVLHLRSLVSRGRATLKRRRSRRRARGSDAQVEHAIEFLVKLGDNGIVWNILSFWKEAR